MYLKTTLDLDLFLKKKTIFLHEILKTIQYKKKFIEKILIFLILYTRSQYVRTLVNLEISLILQRIIDFLN